MIDTQKTEFPLVWAEGWPRTRPQDRKKNGSWNRTATQYRDALEAEMKRMEAPYHVISCNVPVNQRGTLTKGMEPLDVGVAVYFSKKVVEDFAWQDVLNIHDPAPDVKKITDAFRALAQKHHPDVGGDAAIFANLTKHRDNAIRWVTRKTNHQFDYVIACDAFNEVRLNLAAVVSTLKAIRQIERAGTSSLMERAFKGFSALPAQGDTHAE